MMFLIEKCFIIIIWILFGILNIVTSVSIKSDQLNHQDVINFVKEIKENIDITVNPCDDFNKYACGRMNNLIKPMPYPNLSSYFEKFYIENEPTSEFGKIARKQYLDWKKFKDNREDFSNFEAIYEELDFLNKLGKFPFQSNDALTSKNVAELEAEFFSIIFDNFFHIGVLPLNNTIIFRAGKKPELLEIKNIFNVLNNNRSDSQQVQITINKVTEFIKKMIEVYDNQPYHGETNIGEINSFEELQQVLPSTNFNWKTFAESLNKILNFNKYNGKYKFSFVEYHFLKKIIQLIDSTDIQTIVNFQVLQFIWMLKTEIKLPLLEIFNRHIILKKIWDENLTERTIKRYTNFLNDFEIFFNKTVADIPVADSEYMRNIFFVKQNVLKNHKKLITEENIQELYENYDLEKPYKSFNKFIKKGTEQILDEFFFENSNSDLNRQFLLQNYDQAIELDIKNKPNFYFYNTLQFNLWFKYIRNDPVKIYNMSIVEKCLKQIDEYIDVNIDFGNFLNQYFMQTYAAIKLTLSSMISNEKLSDENKLIKELIQPEKLFFISIAQQTCRQKLKTESSTFRVFRNLEEFSKAFSCPANSKMNRYKDNASDLLNCHAKYK